MESRIFQKFETNDAFVAALSAFVTQFEYAFHPSDEDSVRYQAPGHNAVLRDSVRRWRPLRSDEWRRVGYEPPAVATMSFLINTFGLSCVYDVGAAFGPFTVIAGSTQSHAVTAHGFEMNPAFFDQMVAAIADDPVAAENCHAHLAGVSDHPEGTRTIWFSRTKMFEHKPDPSEYRETWLRRLKFRLRGVKNRDRLVEAEVLLTSIDDFAKTSGDWPDFLKIDVDGYEGKVVAGGRETFATQRPFILLEVHKDKLLAPNGTDRRAVVSDLFDLGFNALFLPDHANLGQQMPQAVDRDSAIWHRQETDMFLFY